MNRRVVLGTLGAAGVSSLAGCLDALPFGTSQTKLARLAVANFDTDDTVTIDIRVTRDGSVVHESTYTIDKARPSSAKTAIADCTWDDNAGEYIVRARLAGTDTSQTFNLLDEVDGSPGCVIARVQYGDFPISPNKKSLFIDVKARCDELGTNFIGGCPEYTSDSTEELDSRRPP